MSALLHYMPYLILLLFTVAMVVTGLGVIVLPNPVHAALALLANLIVTSLLYLVMLGAPFMAMVQLIVYAGAILVFILFVIMLMNLRREDYTFEVWPVRALAGLGIAAVFFFQLFVLSPHFVGKAMLGAQGPDAKVLADLIFSKYLLPFELVSLLIFAAAVGAIALAKKRA